MCQCENKNIEPINQVTVESSEKYINEYIKDVNQAESKVTEQFEKNLLTLSSGALGLSLTILSKNASHPNLILLYESWIAFGITISLSIISYHINVAGMNWQLEKVKMYFKSESNMEYPDANSSPFSKALMIMSWFSTISFLLGLLLTAFFIKEGLN